MPLSNQEVDVSIVKHATAHELFIQLMTTDQKIKEAQELFPDDPVALAQHLRQQNIILF